MNAQTDVAELIEEIRRSAAEADRACRVVNDAKEQGSPNLPPPLPGFAPLTPSDPVPLAEAANMIPRAREKLAVNPSVPTLLRPMFRNQGGFNGVLLEACGRLVEVSEQLRQENGRLQARIDTLIDCLTGQNSWQETLALTSFASEQALQAAAERFTRLEARLQQMETLLERTVMQTERTVVQANEHSGALARLETQTEQYRTWLLNLQIHADERTTREEELEERFARKLEQERAEFARQVNGHPAQQNRERLDRHAEHLHVVDRRVDQLGRCVDELRAQAGRPAEPLASAVTANLSSPQLFPAEDHDAAASRTN